MTMPTNPQTLIQQALLLLCEPGQVVELRVPGTDQGTQSGYFDNAQMLAEAALQLSGTGPGVFITINPVDPTLLPEVQTARASLPCPLEGLVGGGGSVIALSV